MELIDLKLIIELKDKVDIFEKNDLNLRNLNPYILIDGEAGRAAYIKMHTNGSAASQMNFYADDDSLDRVWSINEGANFGDSNADILLKQGGDVGIGTNNPQGAKLHVNGSAIVSGTLFVKNDQIWYDANSTDVIAKLHDNNDDGIFDIYQNNSVINRIHGNGNSYFKGGNCLLYTSPSPRD